MRHGFTQVSASPEHGASPHIRLAFSLRVRKHALRNTDTTNRKELAMKTDARAIAPHSDVTPGDAPAQHAAASRWHALAARILAGHRISRDEAISVLGADDSEVLDLTAAALEEDEELRGIQAYVDDSGEGRWTVDESVELGVPIPVITLSLQARFRSRQEQPYGAKVLAAMRNQFGGHAIKKAE